MTSIILNQRQILGYMEIKKFEVIVVLRNFTKTGHEKCLLYFLLSDMRTWI